MFDITKTKAVLWDLDDTLYSRVDAARQTFPGMFKEHLYIGKSDCWIEEAANYMMTKVHRNSMIPEDAFQALLDKYPPDKPYIRSNCVDYYYEHMSSFAKPFPQQLQVVKKLRQLGIKTAIVTNIATERLASQKKKIQVLQFEGLFDAIVFSGELGIHKPDRRIFDYVAQLLNVENDQCLFVGDDPSTDVMGALNAQMEVVWIDRWGDDRSFDNNPHVHRVQSISEYFCL